MKPDADFTRLIAALTAAHEADHLPPATPEEGIDDLEEPFEMLRLTRDEGEGPSALLQSLAELVSAAHRLATLLVREIPREEITAMIAENAP